MSTYICSTYPPDSDIMDIQDKPETDMIMKVTVEGDEQEGEAIRLNQIHLEDAFPAPSPDPELIQAIRSMERVFKQEIQCLCRTVSSLSGKQQRAVSVTGLSTTDSVVAADRQDSITSKTARVRPLESLSFFSCLVFLKVFNVG